MTQDLWLRSYLQRRVVFERTAWVLLLSLSAAANATTVYLDIRRMGLDFDWWEPVTWEASSALMWMLLVPLIIRGMDAKPLRWGLWRRHLPYHLLFSLLCSMAHVLGMVGLRKLTYASLGAQYDFGNWPRELGYEALKDVRSYALAVALIGSYRLLLWRLQGEASLLDEAPSGGRETASVVRETPSVVRETPPLEGEAPSVMREAGRMPPGRFDVPVPVPVPVPPTGSAHDTPAAAVAVAEPAADVTRARVDAAQPITAALTAAAPVIQPSVIQPPTTAAPSTAAPSTQPPAARPERLLVKKLGTEFLLPVAEIEWVQACGNYVNLHRQGHDYPLRSSLAAFDQRLDPAQFVRVHRSYLVRISIIEAIEPTEAGDAQLRLQGGRRLPCSRTYLEDLRQRIAF
ncbi:LytTr DNA-binding domain-containing protein [Roseateles sp. YR242]|uniref:LytTR family DNA-binding domain-containing protein n=1 Tax=Roseateles sp. YR242 TaxID=1855305 RepID=UPI0008CD7E82|nr:LytTR family DNA-binding domain-containing protein [Roseateles sp. YR242]SEL01221.1 LytTr DNA-binding domain-containing protein [Roseateles sp. YR242]